MPIVSSGLDRWRAGSRNSVTQRFKKDTFNKYRNFTKMPNIWNHWVLFWGKNAIWITLLGFSSFFFFKIQLNFLHFALNLNEYRCQIQFSHGEIFQLSYWRSWLKNFLDLWPKTWILCFEIVIISSLYNLSFAKITYQCLLWSTFMSFQEKLDDLFKLTQSCLWQNSLSIGG